MDILVKDNIRINCVGMDKEQVIGEIGKMLISGGYVDDRYTQYMLDKEKVFNTAIGNQVAIPHCIEEGRESVLKSGIAIMVFPEGIDWGSDEPVRIVIGIAGKGDEHMEILGKIAITLSEISEVERIVNSSVDDIYKTFVEV